MKTVVKILLTFDTPDDPAARAEFYKVVKNLEPHMPQNCEISDFKMVEHGTGWMPGRQRFQARTVAPEAGRVRVPREPGLGPGIDWVERS